MTTDFKNKTPFLLGLIFLALVTTHEIEHIAEAFEIEDEFVVGYGLEYTERFRELNYLGTLNVNH